MPAAARPPKTVTHAAAPKPKAPPPKVQPRAPVLAGVASDAAPSWATAPAAPFGLSGPIGIQRKPLIGAADDPYEREADAVADRVVSGPAAAPPSITPVTPGALRPAAPRETGDEDRRRPTGTVQRATRGNRTERGDDARSRSSIPSPMAARETEEDRADASPILQRATAGDRTAHDDEERTPSSSPASPVVQREMDDDEPKVDASAVVQREAEDGEREPEDAAVQRAEDGRRRWGDGGPAMREAAERAIAARGPGAPLPPTVRATLESRLGRELGGVRVHDDAGANRSAARLHARAFTHGGDIWLGAGESAHDVRLMAHEATHVVQQGAAAPRGQAAAPAPQPNAVQRLIPDWVLEELDEYADYIPGWRLFTVIIGYNPFTSRTVERTATNLLGGLLGLVPFGTAIFDKLNENGIVDAAFDWVRGELDRLDLSLGRIERTIEAAWEDVSLTSGFDYNLGVLRRHFGALYDDVVAFAGSLVDRVMQMIRDAVVAVAEPLLAENRAWALIKKVLGRDPLRDVPVEATPTEILEDFLTLIGQEEHLRQMRERGTLQEAADWIATQIAAFVGLLGQLRGLITQAWEAIQPQNLPDLLTNLRALATDAGQFLQRVWDFATTVAGKVLELIKNALLGWLATFANEVPGFHLLTVILGRNPFTGEAVPRTAENLIRGFITLLPGGDGIYARLRESGTIARAAGRIQGALEELGISWEFVTGIFTGIWESLSIDDLVRPVEAFQRIVDRFAEPVSRLFRFVGVVLREIIALVLEAMNFPSDLIGSILANVRRAIEDIRRDPVGFLLNMLAAVKRGFLGFFDRIGTYLIRGLSDWLFRGLRQAGIEPPQDLSLQSVLGFVLQVLGISMDRIWEKVAARVGRPLVERVRRLIDQLTGIWSFIRDVQQRGITAIWEHIQTQITGLWDMVLERARSWVMERVINRAIQWVASLLDITGITPVINSFRAFFAAVQSAIEYLRDILTIVNDYVATLAAVARGQIGPGAERIERGLGNAVPVAIGFLANQFGLGNIGERIREIVTEIRGVVDRALDWLVDRAVSLGQSVLRSLGVGRREEPPAAQAVTEGEADEWWRTEFSFTDSARQSHTLTFRGTEESAALVVHSNGEQVVADWLVGRRERASAGLRPLVEEAIRAHARFVVTQRNMEALREEFERLSRRQREARAAEYRTVYLTFRAALRDLGRTFQALPVEGEPDLIVLHLPPQKPADLYQQRVTSGLLQHSRQRPPRRTDQVRRWETHIRREMPNSQLDFGRRLGLPEERIFRPNWDRQGVQTQMQVDHRVEWQVRALGDERTLDEPWNYELLDRESNEASGAAINASIDEERVRIGNATGDQSWRNRDITFTAVAGGGSAGRRWTLQEVANGEHLQVWARLRGTPPRSGDLPAPESVLGGEPSAEGTAESIERRALIESTLRTLGRRYPDDAERIRRLVSLRLQEESWDRIRAALGITPSQLSRLRQIVSDAGFNL